MAEVKILIEGYTTDDASGDSSGEEKTCPTITLVKDKDLIIIVDPGVMENQDVLDEKLKAEGLTRKNIDIVFITHSHIDHYRNVGMFSDAKILEYYGLWSGNSVEDWNEQFTDDIQIIKTPGHNYDSLTLLVKTSAGIVAICGDVFWKENLSQDDPYASDKKLLEQSRKKVLKIADWIIPGHGRMFKVKK